MNISPLGHIYLVGPMLSGKSHLAKNAQKYLSCQSIDLDDEFTKIYNETPGDYIINHGEILFRKEEQKVLEKYAMMDGPLLIATGGGTFVDLYSRIIIQETGYSIALIINSDVAMARLMGNSCRPLLGKDRGQWKDEWEKIDNERLLIYRGADLILDGDQDDEKLIEVLCKQEWPHKRNGGSILISPSPYDPPAHKIYIEASSSQDELILDRSSTIIVDEILFPKVAKDYAGHLIIPLPGSEASKSFSVVEDIVKAMLKSKKSREDPIIGIGGGTITDLANFVSSIYMRGVPCGLVPTTLVAQVDAAIGGKTALNMLSVRNILGSFSWPAWVHIQNSWLSTCSERLMRCGLAECFKIGIIGDIGILQYISQHRDALLNGDRALTHALVHAAVRSKWAVVRSDWKESLEKRDDIISDDIISDGGISDGGISDGGIHRSTLNLGHSFAHAIESVIGSSILHGEAVAYGCWAAFDLSGRLSLCGEDDLSRLRNGLYPLLSGLRSYRVSQEDLYKALSYDKKFKSDRWNFILPIKNAKIDIVSIVMDLENNSKMYDGCDYNENVESFKILQRHAVRGNIIYGHKELKETLKALTVIMERGVHV